MISIDRKMIWYATAMAVAYLMFGAFEVAASLGARGEWSDTLFLQGSVMDGLVLMVIGATFAFGWDAARRESGDSEAFVLVGIVIGTVFLCIYLILLGANLLGLVVFGSEHMEGWTIMDSMRPAIYIGLVNLTGAYAWRKRLSLSRLSRAGV